MKPSDKKMKPLTDKKPDWQELYVLTEHWRSDLEFYKDDLLFLHHLVDKYFIWITKSENLEMVKEIMLQIRGLENQCRELMAGVKEHMHNLAQFANESAKQSLPKITEDHVVLETSIYNFVKDFRANRKEVFRITEYVIDSEELTNLMRS